MNKQQRQAFDQVLEEVLDGLPPPIHRLLEEVPLIVEDHPAPEIMDEMGLEYIDDLCGLYTGVPLTEPEARPYRQLPDHIVIYREGILSQAANEQGEVTLDELRKQIRVTVLHEIGHHHGLTEEDLRELGYE